MQSQRKRKPPVLSKKMYGNIPAYYRAGTSDERVLLEVVDKETYSRRSVGFGVEAGEHWLDLGANIGAFAIMCRLKKATCESYEPDLDCYKILLRNNPPIPNVNPGWCTNAAVTNSKEKFVDFFVSKKKGQFSRGTVIQKGLLVYRRAVPNVYAGFLRDVKFDAVKMDIEGSEGPILDEWLLPKCEKLVMEYHLSRDPLAANLRKRLALLRKHFKHVTYIPEIQHLLDSGQKEIRSFYDRNIYAWGKK